MRKGFFLLLGGVCAIGLLVVGCGGGGNDEVSVSSLSKNQYVLKAEEVCEKGTKKIETDFGVFLTEEEKVKHPTKADYAKLVEIVLVPNVETEIEELRELGAPKGDSGEIETMLKTREESIAIAEEDPEAVIHDSTKVFGKASKAADAYGLKTCGTR